MHALYYILYIIQCSTLTVYQNTVHLPNIMIPTKAIIPYQLKLTKMRAELANLNHCAVPYLNRTAVNLCWLCNICFRMFRKDAPFKYDSEGYYGNLDVMHIKITEMEQEMSDLGDSASLFEVNMPEYKQLKQCRKEVKLLKVGTLMRCLLINIS